MKKLLGLAALALLSNGACANWTTYSLPNTTANFNTWSMGHTTGGAFLYAENGTFYKQNAFGAGAYTPFANSPGAGTGPSFISAANGTTALMGTGGWAASELKRFDPSDTSSAFSGTTVVLQNYAGRMRDGNSAYIIGANGTAASNNLTYVTLDGLTTKTLINDISQYSCGFAMDGAGNLYIGDNDDGAVYFFAKSQLDTAIGGAALEMTDGALVANFGSGGNIGSLAVDGHGVLWGAGWAVNGITSYDPNLDEYASWTPGFDSTHYLVDTFVSGTNSYVAFASANGSGPGSNVVYGVANAAAIPEPGTVTLLMAGFGGMLWFRKRRHYFFRG